MGKIIKFPGSDGSNNDKSNTNLNIDKSSTEIQLRIKKAIEEYVLSNFAVKVVLGIDINYRLNDNGEFGAIGNLIYEHKRRAGTFQADFIAKGFYNQKSNKLVVSELAFSAGEPDLYKSIYNTLKAKKLLPVI